MQVYRIKNDRQFEAEVPKLLNLIIGPNDAYGVVRISSDGQKDNHSEAVQIQQIKEYASRKGLKLVAIFCIIESAKSSNDRKVFYCIDLWCSRNKIRHRIYYSSNREARNLTDIERMLEQVRKGLIIVHYALDGKCLDENILPSEMMIRGMVGVFDAHYSHELRHKIAQGQRAKAEGGEFPGNIPPLGYEHQKNKNSVGIEKRRGSKIVPSADQRKIKQVRREFELRALGLSFQAIRNRIIEEGLIPVLEISKYRAATIERRLKNIFYGGYFEWNGTRYKGNYELIVPPEIFRQVQDTHGSRGQYEKGSVSMFGNGWLKCADSACRCNVVADPKTKVIKSTGEKKTYFYYHCTNGKGVHSSQKGMNVSEAKIWDGLYEAVKEMTVESDWGKQLAAALNETRINTQKAIKRDIENYKQALAQVRLREDRLYDRFDQGDIDRGTYNNQRKRLQNEQIEFTNKMEQAQLQITDAGMETAQTILELAIDAESLWKTRSPHERKEFLDIILSNQALEGTSVRYELKKPFRTLTEMKGDANWRRGF